MNMEEEHHGDAPTEDEEAAPLCVQCLRPVPGNPYYCPHCGYAVNPLTPYIPYVEIPFYTRVIGDSVRTIKAPGVSPVYRVGALLGVFVFAVCLLPILPLLLLFTLGYLVYRSWRKNGSS